MERLKLKWYYLLTLLCIKPFTKKMGAKVVIIKPILFTSRFISIGSKVFIRNFARIEGVSGYMGKRFEPSIEISDSVSIEQNLHLTCAGRVTIGSGTAIAANVTITDINHPYKDISIAPEKQPLEVNPVSIGKWCKLYNNSVILPGTTLGDHCIVGANSVVPGKVYPDHCVIAGAPAFIIKRYSLETGRWHATTKDGEIKLI